MPDTRGASLQWVQNHNTKKQKRFEQHESLETLFVFADETSAGQRLSLGVEYILQSACHFFSLFLESPEIIIFQRETATSFLLEGVVVLNHRLSSFETSAAI